MMTRRARRREATTVYHMTLDFVATVVQMSGASDVTSDVTMGGASDVTPDVTGVS